MFVKLSGYEITLNLMQVTALEYTSCEGDEVIILYVNHPNLLPIYNIDIPEEIAIIKEKLGLGDPTVID